MNDPQALPADIAEQRSWLSDYKERTNSSWGKLAAKIGVSAGTISQFPSGAYAGDNQKLADQVWRFRQTLEAKAAAAFDLPVVPTYFETFTSRQIITMLRIAQFGRPTPGNISAGRNKARMVVIAGAPGTSKTSAAEYYREIASNVSIATMAPSTRHTSPMQYTVLEALGADEENRRGTEIALTHRIRGLLRNKDGLLIIDEAHYLNNDALEEIRGWHDREGAGIALIGNEDLLQRLCLGSRKDDFARLFSRLAVPMIFRGPTEEDALAFADAWQIDEREQRDLIVKISRQPGGLRKCTMVMEMAWMLAAVDQTGLNASHIRDALAQQSPRGLVA